MANIQQMQRLRRSVSKGNGCKFWNDWRAEMPEIGINLNGGNISDSNLDGINLVKADLIETEFSGSTLRGAILKQSDLTFAYLNRCDLSQADMRSCSFNKSYLNESICIEANFHKATMIETSFRRANLYKAKLKETYLRESNFTEANLSESDLSMAYLRGAKMKGANLSHANLKGADLRNADLSNTDLSYADLRDTKLRDANLREADLTGANLSGSNLYQADFSFTKLNNANLNGTIFYGIIGQAKEAENIICQSIEIGHQTGKHTIEFQTQNDIEELSFHLTDSKKNLRDLYIKKVRSARNPLDKIENITAPREEYKINKKIGSGITGVVYEAQRIRDGQIVAVKIFDPDERVIKESVWRNLQKRLILESVQAERFNHPNVIKVHEAALWDFRPLLLPKEDIARPLIVMEYIYGLTLEDFLKEELNWDILLYVMYKLTEGLQYIHDFPRVGMEIIEDAEIREELAKRRYTIHKNLHPFNIFLLQENDALEVKLGDIWSVLWEDMLVLQEQQNMEIITQKHNYLAPEEIEDITQLSPKSDIYSLGLIFLYMLTKVKFSNKWVIQRSEEFFALMEQCPCTQEMKDLILAMTEIEPVNRPLAKDVLGLLQAFV